VDKDGELDIPVACIADMDVMPDCAPVILGLVSDDDDEKWKSPKRRWKAKRDFGNGNSLKDRRKTIEAKASGQKVKTFISDEWTLEYDLALGPKNPDGAFPGGLAKDVFVAACLAGSDDALNAGKKEPSDVESSALTEFAKLEEDATAKDGCATEEVLASQVYAKFAKNGVSKPITAQYLAERLQTRHSEGKLTATQLRSRLPKYLLQAIEYVTGGPSKEERRPDQEENTNE